MVYEPPDESTVFIGSSRIKFDLDIPTWQNITGNHAIQLANVGSDPVPYLRISQMIKILKGIWLWMLLKNYFFLISPRRLSRQTKKLIILKKLHRRKESSFQVNHVLESQFVFLDQD